MQRPGINKSSNEVSVGVAQQCFCELGISSEVQFNNREGCPSNSVVSRTWDVFVIGRRADYEIGKVLTTNCFILRKLWVS